MSYQCSLCKLTLAYILAVCVCVCVCVYNAHAAYPNWSFLGWISKFLTFHPACSRQSDHLKNTCQKIMKHLLRYSRAPYKEFQFFTLNLSWLATLLMTMLALCTTQSLQILKILPGAVPPKGRLTCYDTTESIL